MTSTSSRDAAATRCATSTPTSSSSARPTTRPARRSTCDVVEAVYAASDHAVVVVDEAYAEFARAGTPSALELLPGRPRLVVTRTMSKAFAFAGARLGYLAADPAVADALRLVRLPYHLSALTQAAARAAIAHAATLLATVDAIKSERDRIVGRLGALGLTPVPSDANFVLFGGLRDEHAVWAALLDTGVLVRDVGLPGHLRVTAGTPAETSTFLTALEQVARNRTQGERVSRQAESRQATIEPRHQREPGRPAARPRRHRAQLESATGVPFYDHMLTALSAHSLIDLEVAATGDVEVDAHHTVEDVAICLGQALGQALGDKTGISRYGDALVPLDEALAHAVVDVSGRPVLRALRRAGRHGLCPDRRRWHPPAVRRVADRSRVREHRAPRRNHDPRARAGGPRPAPHRRGPVQGAGPGAAAGGRARPAALGRAQHQGQSLSAQRFSPSCPSHCLLSRRAASAALVLLRDTRGSAAGVGPARARPGDRRARAGLDPVVPAGPTRSAPPYDDALVAARRAPGAAPAAPVRRAWSPARTGCTVQVQGPSWRAAAALAGLDPRRRPEPGARPGDRRRPAWWPGCWRRPGSPASG